MTVTNTILNVGNIGLGLSWDVDAFRLQNVHRRFIDPQRPSEAQVRFHLGLLPRLKTATQVFDSEGTWRLYRENNLWQLALHTASFGPDPYTVAVFEQDYSAGDVYVHPDIVDTEAGIHQPQYPVDEIWLVNLLGQGRGVLLHACLAVDQGRGFLFVGQSGAGKSTMARLWLEQPGVQVLSDDRVIVRYQDGVFWAYGTPWHGTERIASPGRVPLSRLFLLRHASHNQAVPLTGAALATRLFVRCFPTFWNPEGIAFTLDFLDRLAMSIPSFDLGFVPDERIVDVVRNT